MKLTMAPPMVLQSCFLNTFLAVDYKDLMDDESSMEWRKMATTRAIREICKRSDPVALARRVSDYLDAAHDGPKIQLILHPLVRTAAIAGTSGLASWKMDDLANMLAMIRGWDTSNATSFPMTAVSKSMSKRELLVALLKGWFSPTMDVHDPEHRAKARLLKSGRTEFMSRMGDVYREMCTRAGPRVHLVAFLPDVIYKTKPFVRFVRNLQRHCTTRRPLFSIRTGDSVSPVVPTTTNLAHAVADGVTFDTISRQYNVDVRFDNAVVHPEIDPWDQDEAQVDRQYTALPGADWHVTRPDVVFALDSTGFIGFDGKWIEDDAPRRTKVESEVCAVIWRDVDGERQIIGYIAKDDTRDFYDVISCAIETWAANGHEIQPCCLVMDKGVCAPGHLIQTFATTGVEEDSVDVVNVEPSA